MNLKKGFTHTPSKVSGFTLIELLVVVAIIGVLASVVLASLNSARNKGADAAVKANLANMRAQAEIFYDGTGNSSYTAVCNDPTMTAAQAAAVAAGNNGGLCSSTATDWAAWAGLKGTATDAWCVDDSGDSKQITKPAGAVTAC